MGCADRRVLPRTKSRSKVEQALTAANQNAAAGFQVAQGQEYLVRGVGRLGDIDAIAAVNVKTTNAAPVLVRDVGIVREGAAIKRGEGSHNAKPAVILGIQKQPAVNTLELTERIDATLEDIQRALPQGMQIHRICSGRPTSSSSRSRICSPPSSKAQGWLSLSLSSS